LPTVGRFEVEPPPVPAWTLDTAGPRVHQRHVPPVLPGARPVVPATARAVGVFVIVPEDGVGVTGRPVGDAVIPRSWSGRIPPASRFSVAPAAAGSCRFSLSARPNSTRPSSPSHLALRVISKTPQ
jgi:hypothetical protein